MEIKNRPNETRVIASVWRRMSGGICDCSLLLMIFLACMFMGLGDVSVENTKTSVTMNGYVSIIASIFYWLCLACMEYKTGKTPGKYMVSTKVVTEDYQAISFFQALLRNMCRLIDSIFVGLVIIICTKENQRFGDLLAKTLVVED